MIYAILIPVALTALVGLLALAFRWIGRRESRRVSEEYEDTMSF